MADRPRGERKKDIEKKTYMYFHVFALFKP